MTGLVIDNDEEYNEVDALVQNVCKVKTTDKVVSAVKNGETVEKVMKETKAGTGCGRCKEL